MDLTISLPDRALRTCALKLPDSGFRTPFFSDASGLRIPEVADSGLLKKKFLLKALVHMVLFKVSGLFLIFQE